jgi:hypothetical protein
MCTFDGCDHVAGVFHDTYEHVGPRHRQLAVAVTLATMPDMTAEQRRRAAKRVIATRSGAWARHRAGCCTQLLVRWGRVGDRAA